MAYLVEKLVEILQIQYGKLEKLPLQTKEKILYIIIGATFANLLYTFLGLYTIISMGATMIGLYILVKVRIEAILDRGLITYLPKKLQQKLLERSLFDFLCDAWFIPRLGLIIKTIVRPLFVPVNPEEAVYQLDDLPEASKKMFLQKGVVNILPANLRNIILPRQNKSTNSEAMHNESEERISKLSKIEKRYQLAFSYSSEDFKIQPQIQIDSCKESDITSSKERNSVISTDDEPKNIFREKMTNVKTWLTIPKPISYGPLGSVRSFFTSRSSKSKKKPTDFKFPKKLEKSYIFDPLDHYVYRSEVISSSKLPQKKPQSQQDTLQKWDKLDTFLKMKLEKSKQISRGAPTAQLKGPLQMIQKLIELLHMGKKGLFIHVDEKKLLKVFSLSTIALFLQFCISKKARCWVYNTFYLLMYVTGILLSSGSFALYILKLKESNKRAIRQNPDQADEMKE